MTNLTVIQTQLLQYLLNVILVIHWLIFLICNLSPVTAVCLEMLGFDKPKYDRDILDTYAESIVRATALLFSNTKQYFHLIQTLTVLFYRHRTRVHVYRQHNGAHYYYCHIVLFVSFLHVNYG